ncbi:hypothetical protein [Streptomyces sp. NBC_00035]|uniref:hypothetical protein n=1 Tax=Streptomyces sp. NBC_00035 TaxID=2903614 RepID=UPI0032528D22
MTGPRLTAGVGKSVIGLPPDVYPLDGFAGEHDNLHARAVLLDDGSQRVALVVVELTSIPEDAVRELREAAATAGRVAGGNTVVCASHTFSAPHLQAAGTGGRSDALLREAVRDAVVRSVTEARRTMRSARVGFGRGTCGVNVNRDVLTADGWWLGADESGVSDKSVGVVRIEDDGGQPLAILMNYAVQSSVMNESRTRTGERLVTSDLAGAACRHVEESYGDGAVALFLIGAAGDQAPFLTANRYVAHRGGAYTRADVHEAGHLLVDLLGERLGAEAVRVSEGIRCAATGGGLRVVNTSTTVHAQVAPARMQDLRPVRNYPFQPDGKAEVPIDAVRIGDIVLVGLRAELSSGTGLGIKEDSPFAGTVVMTMANGAAKYMADAASYDRSTYEAMNSRYARGSAEAVASKVGEILKELRGDDL